MKPQPTAAKAHRHGFLGALRPWTLALSLMAVGSAWSATAISFEATDLADLTAGQDLWRYDYAISGPVDAFGSANLLFSSASYGSLLSMTTDTNLSTLDVQPDAGLGTDGIVYATPFTALLASDVARLSVEFVWFGVGRPAGQRFEVYSDNGFSFVGSGVTVAAVVPEPAAFPLMLVGLVGLTGFALRRRRRGR